MHSFPINMLPSQRKSMPSPCPIKWNYNIISLLSTPIIIIQKCSSKKQYWININSFNIDNIWQLIRSALRSSSTRFITLWIHRMTQKCPLIAQKQCLRVMMEKSPNRMWMFNRVHHSGQKCIDIPVTVQFCPIDHTIENSSSPPFSIYIYIVIQTPILWMK